MASSEPSPTPPTERQHTMTYMDDLAKMLGTPKWEDIPE